ncbi:dihydroxyacetone kinase transcriptional activator DhaS [Sporosalibacterium faouarense]|uniref:dihydroxyacetone kinase transcriptional activator DhaS n=1 Tax=Sporosalibacterium faouarense TaxID=516123 RepID=UPI00192C4E46|nr:dihydroxyacetone kinase transcriptional activator DhaS [Sporosalibacterium faouarense]
MVQSTKRVIADTLKEFMNTKPFDKISVVDIVNKCEINRQTFYYHFQDKYELLGWIFKEEALSKIKNYKTYATWQEGFLKIFLYVKDNRKLCMNTFRSLARDHLDNFLYDITFKLLIDVVNEIADESEVQDKELRFIANFYSFAFIGILTNWMIEGMKENPEEIINNINKLIEGDIKRAIEKYK